MAAEAFGDGSVDIFNLVIEFEEFAGGPTRIGRFVTPPSMTAGKLPTHIGNSSWGFPACGFNMASRYHGG
jgi:hypothetical protein